MRAPLTRHPVGRSKAELGPKLVVATVATIGVAIIAASGCVSWLVPCDARLHLSGRVLDDQRQPVAGAFVDFNGSKGTTDESGCFRFGGMYGVGSRITLTVTKDGYDPYRQRKRFNPYHVTVVMAQSDSRARSTATWQVLLDSDVMAHEACPE